MTAYGSLNDTAVICSNQITFLFPHFAFLLMLLIFYARFLSYLCYMYWNYKPSCSAAQIAFTEISFPIISVCLSLLSLPRFERKQNTNCVSAFACSLQLNVSLALRCHCLYVLLLLPASVSMYNMYFVVSSMFIMEELSDDGMRSLFVVSWRKPKGECGCVWETIYNNI